MEGDYDEWLWLRLVCLALLNTSGSTANSVNPNNDLDNKTSHSMWVFHMIKRLFKERNGIVLQVNCRLGWSGNVTWEVYVFGLRCCWKSSGEVASSWSLSELTAKSVRLCATAQREQRQYHESNGLAKVHCSNTYWTSLEIVKYLIAIVSIYSSQTLILNK